MGTSSLRRNLFPSFLIVALLSSCATLILSSCSKSPSAAIIGKWQVQGQKETIEFRKDGTVITSGTTGNTQDETTGKYTFADGNHMDLQINTSNTNEPVISVSCEVHIHGNKMDATMTTPGDSQRHKVNFKRME